MSFISPASKNAGDLISAAIWNQDVVENIHDLHVRMKGLIVLQEQQPNGTQAGASVAGAYQTRVLNIKLIDTDGICTLLANQFTLPAGTYRCWAGAPGLSILRHRVRIRNISDGTTALLGKGAYDDTGQEGFAMVSGIFTIADSKTFELQHYTQTAIAVNGLGIAVSSGETEIFSQVELQKVN